MSEHSRSAPEQGVAVMPEALMVFDPATGAISYVNASAAELFDLRDDRLAESNVAEFLPECSDPAIGAFSKTVFGKRAEYDIYVRVEQLRGAAFARVGAKVVTARVVAIRAVAHGEHRRDRDMEAGTVIHAPISEALPLVTNASGPTLERLAGLWKLVVRRGLAGSEYVRALLIEGSRGLDLEHASLARVEGDEVAIEFSEPLEHTGTRTPVERSLAKAALRSGSYAVLDTSSDGEFSTIALGMRAFLSSAFRIGDTRWVLTFASARPRTIPFENEDWRYVDDLVEALSRSLERREADARVERLAYSDALTSLPNRIALLSRLDEAIAEADSLAGRAAVLFLDIDGFKGVNDTVGHRGGDTVLAEVAERLRGTLRREEFIGRLGGDEFAIVMPRVADRAEIESIAQRIGGVLTFPFGVDDYRFSLSASIGVAIYPDDAASRDDLLACADAAMYTAKDNGGARVRFRDAAGGFDDAPESEHEDVAAGEARDVGYVLTYQPIVDLATDRIVAVEALIRRVHPLHGLLAPERGWSIARDQSGRRALDRWVLREATTQARAWAASGLPVRVDVNLAAFDLAEIEALFADSELAVAAKALRIEISPSQFDTAEQAAEALAFAEQCLARGMGLVLDGFDGRLGPLSSVASLPIDVIKLDRPMIEGIATSRTARAIVEGAMVVAKSLGWSVVAKGVENAAQQEALASLGCAGVQGFYIAHPMTAVDLGAWLRDRHFAERGA